jgi:hypothetical protein
VLDDPTIGGPALVFYQTNECISREMVDRIQQERKHPDKFKWLAESTDDRGAADYGKRL